MSPLDFSRVVLLDGATGTELERRGVGCELPLWSARALLEAPETLSAVHRAYVEAGADALTACTFRTQHRTLARAGLGQRAEELTIRAVELARRATRDAERPVLVLGSAPPLEDCWRPDLAPDDAALADEHGEHARHLAEAGVDAVLVETQGSVREARAAVRAAADTRLPVVASFCCGPDARLLSGEPLAEALDAVTPFAPAAVAVNCLPPERVAACLPFLEASGLPFGVYANLGAPGATPDAPREHERTPAAFAADARTWLEAGARLVGGCCGTRPAHIRALAEALAR
jgi:S-methylmethionine-dependent homocysteine/selenocysteine methylase